MVAVGEAIFRCESFNGLLIGQGTAGAESIFDDQDGDLAFQWPPHRPRHCRDPRRCDEPHGVRGRFNGLLIGQGTAGLRRLALKQQGETVSMASSSAKALPDVGISDILRAIRVSMASSSAKALPACTAARFSTRSIAFQWPPHRPRHCRGLCFVAVVVYRAFQWPPHRPRHCRRNREAACTHDGSRFNGLLIGQGTAGESRSLPNQASTMFQWPPHRPRHCRRLFAKCRRTRALEARFRALPKRV